MITNSKISISNNECELDDIISEKSAEPLKDIKDVEKIRNYFLDKKQYRNHMLFVLGINLGLRVGDLLNLKFGHLINADGSYKKWIVLIEEKTKNTRKQCKKRKLALSNVSKDAIELYIKNNPDITRDAYLFRNESTNNLKRKNGTDHMTRQGVQLFINKAFNDLELTQRHGTHFMRKTFAYHVLTKGDAFERARNLEKLQNILGHSSSAITLKYAGITDDEVYKTYTDMNYGLDLINFEFE